MELFAIARKNIKGNAKHYFLYFFSLLISVVTYYTFAALQYNHDIQAAIETSNAMQSTFMIGMVVLLLFVAIFVAYSNSFFIKKRKKEIGLYALLGLRKRTIALMLFYENLILGVVVLGVGILIGIVLSQGFATLLARLLDASVDIKLSASPQAVLMTTLIFLTLIFYVSVRAYRLIYRFKLVELFRAEKEGEAAARPVAWLGLSALVLIGGGYWLALQPFSTTGVIMRNLGLSLALIIAGTYVLFRSATATALHLLKKRRQWYWRGNNLISISQLLYRLCGNMRMLTAITLLSALTLCFFTSGYGMYYGGQSSAHDAAPFSYMITGANPAFAQTALRTIQQDTSHSVRAKQDIPIIRTKGETTDQNLLPERYSRKDSLPVKVVSQTTYEQTAKLLGAPTRLHLQDNQTIAIRPMYTDRTAADYAGESITLSFAGQQQKFDFTGMQKQRIINWSAPDFMMVISNAQFAALAQHARPTTYTGITVANQEQTAETTKKLERTAAEAHAPLFTYYSTYRQQVESAGTNVFIMGFLGFIFLMATGSIIYFKQLTEALADQQRYSILRKIGVSKKELRHVVAKQAMFIFGLPLAVGIVHALVLTGSFSRLFGNTSVNLTVPILVSIGVFVLAYAFYFALTVRSMVKLSRS